MNMTNRKIYESLLKRDSKEKNVVTTKLIEANDQLVQLVNELQNNIDYMQGQLELNKTKIITSDNHIAELRILVKEKDAMIHKLLHKK